MKTLDYFERKEHRITDQDHRQQRSIAKPEGTFELRLILPYCFRARFRDEAMGSILYEMIYANLTINTVFYGCQRGTDRMFSHVLNPPQWT